MLEYERQREGQTALKMGGVVRVYLREELEYLTFIDQAVTCPSRFRIIM